MKPVTLDFGAASHGRWHWLQGRHQGPARWAAGGLLSLAVAVLLILLHDLWRVQQALEATRQSLARPSPAPRSTAANLERDRSNAQQLQLASGITRQLNTPWPALFDALENAAHPEVALVSIEPDTRKRSVRIVAEARTLDALLVHAKQVGATAPFVQVTLIRHEPNEQDPHRPLRLQFDALLKPPAPVPGEATP